MKGPPAELVERWRSDAERLRAYGDRRMAAVCEAHADQVEKAWRDYLFEPLSVRESAKESGFSASHLYQQVETGRLPNVSGENRKVRIRRVDLPRKPCCRSRSLITRDRAQMREELLHRDS